MWRGSTPITAMRYYANRRSLIYMALTGKLVTAGCLFQQATSPALVIFNGTDDTKRVELSITFLREEEVVFFDQVDLEPRQQYSNDDLIEEEGEYRLDIRVRDGPTGSYKWYYEKSSAKGIEVIIKQNTIQIEEVVD